VEFENSKQLPMVQMHQHFLVCHRVLFVCVVFLDVSQGQGQDQASFASAISA